MSTAVSTPTFEVSQRGENHIRSLVSQSVTQTYRQVLGMLSVLPTTIQSIVYPALMLLMFRIVLGDSVTRANMIVAGGQPSIYGYVALMSLVGAMAGSSVGAVRLLKEAEDGLITRFWTLPTNRAADLIGRLVADGIRIAVTTLAIMGVGYTLGFRINGDFLTFLALLAVPVAFGVMFSLVVTALAVVARSMRLIDLVALLTTLLMFFNSGFVPLAAFPRWLQPYIEHQPMSYAIEAMKALAWRGDPIPSVTGLAFWVVGVFAVLSIPVLRGYRRMAREG